MLDEHDVQALAEPFRRLGTERTGSDTGSGLGLSIVLPLPRCTAAAWNCTPSPEAASRQSSSFPWSSRRGSPGVRVLVVEDTRSLADGIAEGLRDRGMAVDVAYQGQDAADKLDINAYDVVVLDRDLPGVHGVTRRMIASSGKAIMVLMLTASGSPDDRVSGLSLGADDYLAKPFHFPELVLRILALARRQPAARSHSSARPARTRSAAPYRPPRRAATSPLRQGVRGARSAHASRSRCPQRRRPSGQAWDEHADPFTATVSVTMSLAPPQARRATGHRDRTERRIPDPGSSG